MRFHLLMRQSEPVPLKSDRQSVDCVYIAACSRDARLTRICVASIRYFYPEISIRLLAGDVLQCGLADELQKYWDVELVNLPIGDYGWGLVKLEPLFGPPGQKFLVLDVDTIFTGRVLDLWNESSAPFLVDDEHLPDEESKRYYYEWDKLRDFDPDVQPARIAFNVGQWFGTAGVVTRDEFDPLVEWTLPRQLRYQQYFMGGDQGVINYVLLKKEALEGLPIERRTIMRWPGKSLDGLSVDEILGRKAAPLVIHWAGLKKTFLRSMIGGDILSAFESVYYQRLRAGQFQRILAIFRHVWIQWSFAVSRRVKLRMQIWFGAWIPEAASTIVTTTIER